VSPVFRHRDDKGVTPQEREERIKALRQKRDKRLRYLAVRGAIGAGALVLALIVFGYWLLTTVGGRDFLLAEIVARLPAGSELEWQRVEGPASGPLTLYDVRFTHGEIVFTAQRVHLDHAIRPLLSKRLELDLLQVDQATLDLPISDEPFELPRWPESLPQVEPPLGLQADRIEVNGLRVTREGTPVIDIHSVRGGMRAERGELALDEVVVDSDRGRFSADGEYLPGDNYRSDLLATAVLPAAAGRTPARLGLVARGDLSYMDVAVAGRAPGPVRATLVLRGEDPVPSRIAGTGPDLPAPVVASPERPQWQLQLDAEALDPGLLIDPTAPPAEQPMSISATASGLGGDMRLRGEFSQGDFQVRVPTSRLRLEEQRLSVRPLRLELLGGTVVANGHADLSDPGAGDFRFAVNARDLEWGGDATADATPIGAEADLGLAGTTDAWALIGDATLSRAGEQAQVRLDGRGGRERMRLETLRVDMPTGTLGATGSVAWAPALGWDIDATLAGFDPGYFVAGWDGAVNGRIASTGSTREDGGLEVAVDIPDIGGRLRGRPLDGSGSFAMHGAATAAGTTGYEGDIALALGESRVDAEGSLGERIEIDARFSPLQLSDLLPDAGGALRGTVQVTGRRDAPGIEADLSGSRLRYGTFEAGKLALDGRLPWAGGQGALRLTATDLVAGLALDRLEATATGAVEDMQLQADARGDMGAVALAGSVGRRGNGWRGTLARLQLQPQRGASWQLQQPAAFAWSAGSTRIDDACLASSAGGSLCADADWPGSGISVTADDLPLSMVAGYLPEREPGRPWILRGDVDIDAQVRPVGGAWAGQARVSSTGGGMKTSERARTELLRYEDLLLTADFRPQGLEADLAVVVNEDGHLDASLATGWDAYSPIDGQASFRMDELTWMELFSPDIVEPTGLLTGQIAFSGTRDQPRIDGQARLSEFSTEIPALAITLREGNLQLDARGDGTAGISGSVRSASAAGNPDTGLLRIDGSLDWQGQDTPLVLAIRGTDVLVSDTRDLRAVASPDLLVRYGAGQPLRLEGSVTVPEARIDLEQLDQGVSASPDVVVLDPVDPEAGPGTPLDMDLRVVVGEDVLLDGFGLEGSLEGSLRVRSRPGREMTATGSLEVDGEYTAYGQDLEISGGRMVWSNDPISDPILDIRAQREVGEVTAGISVTGRVSDLDVEVWSDPASTQSEALAYLTLGRPLSTLSGAERSDVDLASSALTAGGSYLASQIGTRIGLDDAGVMQSRALGGSVFGVGKFLSPRLYVGFGVSLLGTGQVLTLRYLLDHGFDVEIESSSVENRGSVNWRKER